MRTSIQTIIISPFDAVASIDKSWQEEITLGANRLTVGTIGFNGASTDTGEEEFAYAYKSHVREVIELQPAFTRRLRKYTREPVVRYDAYLFPNNAYAKHR